MINRYFIWLRFYILILLVGIIAGLGAIFFRELVGFIHNLFFYGRFSVFYDVFQHAAPSRFGMGIILVPVVGAICVAFLVKNFAMEAKGPGVSEVIDVIYYRRGIIRPIVMLIKPLVSAICIGSGGSAGREGPIIHIGAAFGSSLGQWVKVADWERITLIACGAGGGIAATFNTPLSGVMFAVEIMLPELSARTIIPVSIATAIATSVSYLYFGNITFLPIISSTLFQINIIDGLSYLLLSMVLGVVSALFILVINGSEKLFDRIHGHYYVRHMLGMLLMGLSMYVMMQLFGHYYIQGAGYATVVDVLNKTLTHPGFLFFLAILKLLDTAITLGSGGSGGVFSPLLFIGATLGASFVYVCDYFFPGYATINVQLGALVGMAGMVGASTGASMTAIIMTAELTNDFSIILPLMMIVAIAYAVRRVFVSDSVYTLKLTQSGHPIPDSLQSRLHVMT